MSGFDAGCLFAHSMQIMESIMIQGTVLVECGPYGTDFTDWTTSVKADDMAKDVTKFIDKQKKAGNIETTRMLFTDAAYVVAGTQDETVPMAAVDAMK